MADNIFENQLFLVDSSIIMSKYFLNYYIIARYNMFSMRTTKTNTHTSIGFYFMSLMKLVLFIFKSGLKYYIQQMTLPSQVLCGI